jgi:hypothetical protein
MANLERARRPAAAREWVIPAALMQALAARAAAEND